MNTTTIIALLGVTSLFLLNSSIRGKLSSWLSKKQGSHETTQNFVKEKIEVTNKEINEIQNKIVKLDHKANVTKDVIKEIIKDGNKKVDDLVKNPEMKKLIEEFDKW